MRVAEVMSRGVERVDPSATVQDAATRMAELDTGAVFIGTDAELTGILTDRDVLLRVVVEGKNPTAVKAGDVMSPDLYTCNEDDTVESVFATMRERQIRRMPVHDADGQAIGVVALSDLARVVESPEKLQEAVREISEPHRSRKAPEEDEAESAPPEADGERRAAGDA